MHMLRSARRALIVSACALITLPAQAVAGNGQNPHDSLLTFSPPLGSSGKGRLTIKLNPGRSDALPGVELVDSSGDSCGIADSVTPSSGLAIMRLDREIFEACMGFTSGCSGGDVATHAGSFELRYATGEAGSIYFAVRADGATTAEQVFADSAETLERARGPIAVAVRELATGETRLRDLGSGDLDVGAPGALSATCIINGFPVNCSTVWASQPGQPIYSTADTVDGLTSVTWGTSRQPDETGWIQVMVPGGITISDLGGAFGIRGFIGSITPRSAVINGAIGAIPIGRITGGTPRALTPADLGGRLGELGSDGTVDVYGFRLSMINGLRERSSEERAAVAEMTPGELVSQDELGCSEDMIRGFAFTTIVGVDLNDTTRVRTIPDSSFGEPFDDDGVLIRAFSFSTIVGVTAEDPGVDALVRSIASTPIPPDQIPGRTDDGSTPQALGTRLIVTPIGYQSGTFGAGAESYPAILAQFSAQPELGESQRGGAISWSSDGGLVRFDFEDGDAPITAADLSALVEAAGLQDAVFFDGERFVAIP